MSTKFLFSDTSTTNLETNAPPTSKLSSSKATTSSSSWREYVTSWITWKNSCHLFFFVAATLCFLPQILGYNLLLDPYADDDLQNLSNPQYHLSLVASTAITVLLLIESVLDSVLTERYVPKEQRESDTITYFEFPKELLLLIIGKGLVLILYIIPYQAYNFLPGLLLGQDIVFTWSYFYNLTRLGSPVWTLPKVFVIAVILSIVNIIYSWVSMSEEVASLSDLTIVYQTAIAVAFFFFFVVIGQWIHYVWNLNKESTDMLTYLQVIQASAFIFFFSIYLLATWANSYDPTVTAIWNTFGLNYLTTMVYIMSGCTACVSIISGRVSKFGSIIFSNVSKILLFSPFCITSIILNYIK